jgi:ketosteroid isomerase-like protein
MAKTPTDVAQEFIAAWNAHDVERILALFTDDATVDLNPPAPGEEPHHEGKAALRAWVTDEVRGFHTETRDLRVEGDTVRCYAEVQSDDTRAVGVEKFGVDAVVRVRGEQVSGFSLTLTPDTLAELQALTPPAQA